jgi:hypothetical protein
MTDCPSPAVVGLTVTFEDGKQQRVHCAWALELKVRQAAANTIKTIGRIFFITRLLSGLYL